MAGRIRDESVAEVRENARIDDVISAYVTLRNAGSGNLKGLCPFHDEKSPSFNVTPSRGVYHCFGCGAGGDAIKFVMEMDGTSFTETVERLADKFGVQLHYDEGSAPRENRGPQRGRLIEAHRLAGDFYTEMLTSPDAAAARQFLAERGFDRETAEVFGVGFSPRGGEDLLRHLRGLKFTDAELVASGLIGEGRGLYDRFRGRLMWPIRDTSGDTIGFGARRIFEDDRIEAKYLNTPETALYKKSHVLYGLDLARREMARSSRAVIVEGYTDVMACHVAGVKTAVATCGTAFGDDHARIIRRLLQDHDEFRGEVIFTFDGDAAGQKAAMRAFEGDQIFAGQTYVAVEPNGLDPCDLRLKEGDAAVRELVARRTPLYRFVLGNVVKRYDLDRADGRIDAVREGAKLVRSIRDRSKVDAFARELAGMVGVDPDEVRREVKRASAATTAAPSEARPAAGVGLPDPRDPRLALERDTLRLLVQRPELARDAVADLDAGDFTHPAYAALWRALDAEGGFGEPSSAVRLAAIERQIATVAPNEEALQALRDVVGALAVEPIRTSKELTDSYVYVHACRLRELTARRRIDEVKSRLQRMNPVTETTEYNRMYGELIALEQFRRDLSEQALAAQ
ncbi:MAG: DNA primase [Marmoricola sp.]